MTNHTSKSDAGRIQATQAKSGGDMSSGGFTARAQGAGDRNTNAASAQGSKPSNNSGSGNIGAGKGGSTGDSNTGAQGKR